MIGLKLKTTLPTTTALAIAFAAVTALSSTAAEARLLSAQLPAPDDSRYEAVHLPTGCMARVVLDRDDFIGASITDPACLPKGVEARVVPGSLKDFRLIQTP